MTVALDKKPMLYARFLERDILSGSGRHLFSLLNSFAVCGYKVKLSDTVELGTSDRIGELTRSLRDLVIRNSIPDDSEECFYIFDREDKACARRKWKKKIQIRFDIFSSYWLRQRPIIMPFPMHPVHWGHYGTEMEATLERLRASDRRLRVFFSGDTKGYIRPKVAYPNVKLSRPEIIKVLLDRLGNDAEFVSDEPLLHSLFDGGYTNKCVILDIGKLWIDDSVWLPRLAAADFFLSPPGYCMPMCHNAVEAMAVGTIPVTNYPEWFVPQLEHIKNCLAFTNENDLVSQVRHALEMSPMRIAEMRKRVIEYYENYLRPQIFVRNIEAEKKNMAIALMISDRYVAKNASKLSRRSILLRSKAKPL